MKISSKKVKIKNQEKLSSVLKEYKISVALDKILEKLLNNPSAELSINEIQLIKNNIHKFGNIDSYFLTMLIMATKDSEFIKTSIRDNRLKFSEYDKVNLVGATKDADFIKKSIYMINLPIYQKVGLFKTLIELDDVNGYINFIDNLMLDFTMDDNEKKTLISTVKEHPDIDIEEYIEYLERKLEDPIIGLNDFYKEELIQELKGFDSMQTVILNQNGTYSFTKYEWYLLSYMRSKNVGLNSYSKSRLIIDTKDIAFYNGCLYEKELLDSAGRRELIKGYHNLEGITDLQYFSSVLSVIQDQNVELTNYDKIQLIKDLKKIPEITEANLDFQPFGKLSKYDAALLGMIIENNANLNFSSREKSILLSSIGNLSVIDYFVSNPAANEVLNLSDKVTAISLTENREYIIKCIENKDLYLGAFGKINLILGLDDTEILREYIERDDFLRSSEKVQLLLATRDEEYIKKSIEDESLYLMPLDKARLIIEGIHDINYRRECLQDEIWENDLAAKNKLVNGIGSEVDKQKWNSRIISIKNVSELTEEEIKQLPSNAVIKTEEESFNFYNKAEFLQIKQQIDEIISGVEIPTSGDDASEIKAFLEITKRLSMHMSYDKYAVSKEGEKDAKLQRECRSLYGGLINGECVCAGYACILKHTLACVGIESKFIKGFNNINGDGHAWNQVKIGGKWFNVDLTQKRNEIVRMGYASKEILMDDAEFAEIHSIYSENRSENEEVCITSIKETKSKNGIESVKSINNIQQR